MSDDKFTWQAYEYTYTEKSVDWFWAVGIIALSLAVTAVILGNLLFALLILIGSFALVLQAVRKPKQLTYELNERGVIVDTQLYPYGTLESFWVEHGAPPADGEEKIIIKSKKALMPYIVIPIEGVRSEDVRSYLLEHLPEEEHTEPTSQKIMERLGF